MTVSFASQYFHVPCRRVDVQVREDHEDCDVALRCPFTREGGNGDNRYECETNTEYNAQKESRRKVNEHVHANFLPS